MRAHAFDKGEAVNIMKGAITTSDRIMTVSQGYAWEITTPEGERNHAAAISRVLAAVPSPWFACPANPP
jgi:glycogen synthase